MDRFHYWLAAFQVTRLERRVKAIHCISKSDVLSIFGFYIELF